MLWSVLSWNGELLLMFPCRLRSAGLAFNLFAWTIIVGFFCWYLCLFASPPLMHAGVEMRWLY